MQVLKEPYGDTNARSMQIEHEGEIIMFNIGFASNIGISKDPSINSRELSKLLRDVNAYWATLPYDRQNSIFNSYKTILAVCEAVADPERLLILLRREMSKLMELHPYEEVEQFVKLKGTVKYPIDLKLEYGPGAPMSPLTYLRSDYENLMAFTLLVRIALPVLGEFLSRTKRLIDTNHKEIIACRILSSSQLVKTIPYIKLQTYMATYVKDQDMSMAALMGGMGTEQLPEWLLALTIVRRVAIIELPGAGDFEEPKNLVREIYNYVKSCVENPDKRFGGPIKPKGIESSAGRADDDNTSGAELIKIKEKASEGDSVYFGVFVSNPLRNVRLIDPTIPENLLQQCIKRMAQNNNFARNPTQTTLIQWTLSAVLNPRAIEVLERDELRLAAAQAQALLWHWGFADLAVMVTAQTSLLPENVIVGSDIGAITRQQMETLAVLYPHFQIPKDRKLQRVNISNITQQQLDYLSVNANPARLDIGNVASAMVKYVWTPNAPAALVALTTFEKGQNGLLVPKTLKQQLAALVIKFRSTYKG